MILTQGSEIVVSLGSWPVEVLRGVCIVGAAIDLVLLIPVGTRQRRAVYHETLMFVLLGIAATQIMFTEIGRIGHVLTWRLPLNTLYVIGLAWWLLTYLRLPLSFVQRRRTEPDPPVFRRHVRGSQDGT